MKFKHSFTCLISGPTQSGKTVFVQTLLQNRHLFDTEFDEVLWHYGVWQSAYDKMAGVRFVEGLPRIEDFDGKPKLVIIDDLMHESNDDVGKIFTKYSHHKNISVIYITQNLFHRNKNSRDLTLNSHYIVVFKNPRDKLQFRYLARQIMPGQEKFAQDSYEDATSKPHGYLLIDLKQQTEEHLRLVTDIFDEYPTYYIPTRNSRGYK